VNLSICGQGDFSQLIQEMEDTIEEFFDSHDFQEVSKIIGELHLSKDHEIVFLRLLLIEAMRRQQIAPAIDLTKYLLEAHWTKYDVSKALEQIRELSDDLVLDTPHIVDITTELVYELIAIGAIDEDFPKN
jgi:hypothetical protein